MEYKRTALYIKTIRVAEGVVMSKLMNKVETMIAKGNKDFSHIIDTQYLQPYQQILLTATTWTEFDTYHKDEDGTFYNLGQTISTDQVDRVEVRAFLTKDIKDLDTRTHNIEAFVYADLVFRR